VINSVGAINNFGLLADTGAAGLSLSGTIEQQLFYGIAGPGVIEASGASAKVLLNAGTEVVGGKITTLNGGVVQTVSGNVTFDGSSAAGVTGVVNSGLVKIVDGSSLTVKGNLTNSGTIEVTTPYYGTPLRIDASGAFFAGAGKIQLDSGSEIVGTSTTSPADLENSSNIVGTGSLGIGDGSLTLTNRGAGVVNATGGLTINTDNNVLQNNGLLEATTGVLTINSRKISQTGTIFANGSNVVLTNADVMGGTIKSVTGSSVQTSGSVMYDGVTTQVQQTGVTEIVDGSSLTLRGQINNTGAIQVDSPYYGTNVYIDRGGATLTGKGSIYMLGGNIDHAASSIFSTVYNVDNMIFGQGTIGSGDAKLGLINEGRILSFINGTLTLNTGDTITNSGLIEGDSTGGLSITSSEIENVSKYGTGSLLAANQSFISLTSATIHGGSLNVGGTGFYRTTDGGSVLDGSGGESLTVNGAVALGDGTSLTIVGSIVNKSSFALSGNYYGAHISIAKAGATLTGGGKIIMTGGVNSLVGGQGNVLTNTDNTISGAGSVGDGTNGIKFINDAGGVVNATDGTLQFQINASSQTVANAGLFEATGKAGLQVVNSSINQTPSGKLLAGNGSKIDLNNATITGGTLQTAGTGYFDVMSSAPTIDSVKLVGTFNVADGGAVDVVHTITNNGVFALSGNYYGAHIVTKGATLAGGGVLTMTGGVNYLTGAQGVTLTNLDNTISGAGSIGDGSNGIKFINDAAGVVDATDGSQQFFVNTSVQSVFNAGLFEGTGKAGLQVVSSTIDQTAAGKLLAGNGSKIDLNNSTITGGVLQTVGTGYFDVVGSAPTLDGVKLIGTVDVADGAQIDLAHTITNNGVFAMTGNYYGARIVTQGATLAGGGKITMTGGVNYLTGAAGVTLENVDNKISGAGAIGDGSNGIKFVNDAAGVVNGSDATHQMVVNTFSDTVVNKGLIEATGAAGVQILNSSINQTGGGKILAVAGSKVDFSGASILGGTLQSSGSGFFETQDTGSVIAGATVSGKVEIGDGKALFAASIVNSGTFSVDGSYYGSKLSIEGSWSGGGDIVLSNFSGNSIVVAGTWTNVDNTISGAGTISGSGQAQFTNQGTVEAIDTANALTISTGKAVVNKGVLEASKGALNIADAVTGAGTVLIKNGGVANFESSFAENVTFQGANAGVLSLAKADTGQILGFAAGDKIDLAAIAYSASYEAVWRPSAGSLQIIDTAHANSVVATLKLAGESLSGELVTLSSDGAAGTAITLTPKSFVTVAPHDIVYSSISNKPYSAYEQVYDGGSFLGTDYFYTTVAGQAYSAYEMDYSVGGIHIGTKDFYTGVKGKAYTAYEYDYDGGNHLTRVDFTGVVGQGYSSYETDYVGGVRSGSEYEYTAVPNGAIYSSYEKDYNAAGAYVGEKFFYTSVAGKSYSGEEIDDDANGKLARDILTGVTGQGYTSIEKDYNAGTYVGDKEFFTGVTGQAYTGYEKDFDSAGHLLDTIYGYANVKGQAYYAYAIENDANGTKQEAFFDLNNGGHQIVGYRDGLTLHSIGDDKLTGGGAGEHFVFNGIYGHDEITDFATHDTGANHDVISLSTAEFANFSALTASAANSGANVVITAKDGDKLTLDGLNQTALAKLSADFTFHA
jgi:hypothetical protein